MREYLEAALDPTSRHGKLFVFNTCPQLKEEIEGYTWATFGKGALKGMTKDKPVKKFDHAVNATQYLLSLRPKGRKSSSGAVHNPSNSYT
jgi:hypothetical protein